MYPVKDLISTSLSVKIFLGRPNAITSVISVLVLQNVVEAVGVLATQVAGAEPAVGAVDGAEDFGGRLGAVVVALHDVVALDRDLAGFSRWQRLSTRGIDDAKAHSRPGLAVRVTFPAAW